MAIAVTLLVSESQREVFHRVFREAKTNMHEHGIPPHISLAVFDSCDRVRIDSVVQEFSQGIHAMDIYLSSLAMFPVDHPTVYALPHTTSALLDLHRRFYAALGNMAEQGSPYYWPDHWGPHLTLGTADTLASALEIMSVAYQVGLRGNYLFDELVIIEYYPVMISSSYRLPLATVEITGC